MASPASQRQIRGEAGLDANNGRGSRVGLSSSFRQEKYILRPSFCILIERSGSVEKVGLGKLSSGGDGG